jgi:hypothetical protein
VVVLPLMVVLLLRLNRQYRREATELEHEVPAAATAPILRRHVVLVFVDRLDAAAARSIQYARTLTPDELRAVHFVIDDAHADDLAARWQQLGLQRVPLELVACPDRRLTRTAVECVARELADRETEVTVLLPERKYKGAWHRVLHDKTGEAIQEQVSRLPHANVTTVPFHFGTYPDRVHAGASSRGRAVARIVEPVPEPLDGAVGSVIAPADVVGVSAIADARWRQHVTLAGEVRSVRIAPLFDAPTIELVLADGTGAISVLFLGRRNIAGITVGTKLVVEGTVGIHKARLALRNPGYRLLPNGHA